MSRTLVGRALKGHITTGVIAVATALAVSLAAITPGTAATAHSKLAQVRTQAPYHLAPTPVFAQSFDPEAGTGNLLPSYFDADGGLRAGIAGSPHKTADRQGRPPVYAMATTSSRRIHRRWASRAR